jgi:hypothetical protein
MTARTLIETTAAELLDCINGPEGCTGLVELRMALSATGIPYPRCDGHWTARLAVEDRLRVDYPDTACPPAWFDPDAAGERWDEDY